MKQVIIERLQAEIQKLQFKMKESSDEKSLHTCSGTLDRNYRLAEARIHPGFRSIPQHRQGCIEMMYIYSGQVIYGFDGKEEVLEEGDMILLTPYIRHEIFSVDKNAIAISIFVLPEFFESLMKMPKTRLYVVDFFFGMLKKCQIPQILQFRLRGEHSIQVLMENIVSALAYQTKQDPAILQYTLSLVFLEIIHRKENFCMIGSYDYQELLVQASLKYLEENYIHASLQDLAATMQTDERKLEQIIGQKSGFSFYELQAQKRFHKAVLLLLETDYTIEEIAEQTGNKNLSLFYKQFRHRYGSTPYQFRKRNKNSDNVRL